MSPDRKVVGDRLYRFRGNRPSSDKTVIFVSNIPEFLDLNGHLIGTLSDFPAFSAVCCIFARAHPCGQKKTSYLPFVCIEPWRRPRLLNKVTDM